MYRALISFSGLVSMAMGEVRDISDPSIVQDLLKAGYIEPVEEAKPKTRRKARKEDQHARVN